MTISASPLVRLASRIRPGIYVLVVAVLLVGAVEPVAGGARQMNALPIGQAVAESVGAATPPNIVVIMTDDQDVGSVEVMRNVKRLLTDRGTTFTNSFASYPWCCPSRATFLSGQYAHNHGVLGNHPPDGGQPLFREKETLPVWLSRAGYTTAYIGKYLNGYGQDKPEHVPPGWNEWYAGVDPTTYRMWGYTLNENGALRTYGKKTVEDPKLYQTDVLARKAVDYIKRKAPEKTPFFLSFMPLAPHVEGKAVKRAIDPARATPRPAPRHAGVFADRPLPTPPSFNEADVSDKPWHIRRLPLLEGDRLAKTTATYRARLGSLLAVDEAVAAIFAALQESGELDNTLVIYTSDNGWMQGEHRLPCCKNQPYDGASRVPLIMRGPGVAPGVVSETMVSNVDLAPTILEAAHAEPGLELDGRSLFRLVARTEPRELLLETGPKRSGALSYSGIRTRDELYVEYSTGERELYDLRKDPHNLESKHDDPDYADRREDLAKRLKKLRTCHGKSCP